METLLGEFNALKAALLDQKFASPYEHTMAVWGSRTRRNSRTRTRWTP